MATTFGALSEDPAALAATIQKSPGALQAGIDSFKVQEPFLADFADLSARLRPAVSELRSGLPTINKALAAGIPAIPQTIPFNKNLKKTLHAANDLFSNPNTLLAINDLRTTLRVTTPAVQFIAPYETVCNYGTFFFDALSDHWSGPSALGGTTQNQGVKLANLLQPNTLGSSNSSRPWDVPPGMDPIGASENGMPLGRAFGTPYAPAIDAQGNADCQIGQTGYPKGPDAPNLRYKPGVTADGTPTGGNYAVTESNFPILSGPTYISQSLGIHNLKDVDKVGAK
jgi:hypothetical protein